MAAAAATAFCRESLGRTVQLTALVLPHRAVQTFRSQFRQHVWHGTKYIVPAERDDAKLLLLKEGIGPDLAALPDELRALAAQHGVTSQPYELRVRYEDMTVPEVLDAILPADLPRISAFETIGHIAHVNLKDGHEPYRQAIGQVILDKNQAAIRTVVNKQGTIDNTFRNFAMEVIAGEPDFQATVHESGCTFAMDYSKVYWNSRLATEHGRLVSLFSPDDVICDVFAGIGPFAVPAAKMGATVHANDLNPTSVHYLKLNAERNHVATRLRAYNLDGREFVQQLIRDRVPFTQVVMNLPAIAIDFLDVLRGFPLDWPSPLPRCHCYCFSNAADYQSDVIERVQRVLACPISDVSVHDVRLVSPKKHMLCVSFPVLPGIAFANANGLPMGVVRLRDDSERDDGGDEGDGEQAHSGAAAAALPAAKRRRTTQLE